MRSTLSRFDDFGYEGSTVIVVLNSLRLLRMQKT